MDARIACYLKTFVPVHIGCDEVYEPTGFVMDEDGGQMVVFDPFEMIAQLPPAEREQYSAICRKGTIASLLEIYKFLRARKVDGRAVPVCPGLLRHYRETLDLPAGNERTIQQELNRFTISRTAFLPADQRPFIPGTSLKGAIRTAVLNGLAEGRREGQRSYDPRKAGQLESDLLDGGRFDTDPFRLIKVSDFTPVGEIRTRVVYAVNEKKRPSKYEARGPYQILEVIEPGSVFQGWIHVGEPLPGAKINRPITRAFLLESLAGFYQGEKDREDDELGEAGLVPPGNPVKNGGAFLVRIGRHSGAESVTIENYRKIRIMKGGGKPAATMDHATTFWLAAQERKPADKRTLVPFGWTVLNELAGDLERDFRDREEAWRKSCAETARRKREEAEAALRAIQEEQERQRQEQERKEREARARREAEEKRAVELEAMLPEQREISRLEQGELSEQEVVDLFNRMDSFEEKRVLAAALKRHWVENKKWSRKDCSKKQLQKVQKVKGVLGE